MPDVVISVGGREFDVACQEGEQPFLEAAATLLNAEAEVLVSQMGRMPEQRMLLMSGLMLADKAAGLEDEVAQLRKDMARQEALIEELRARTPEAVETDAIPPAIVERFAALAEMAEGLKSAG